MIRKLVCLLVALACLGVAVGSLEIGVNDPSNLQTQSACAMPLAKPTAMPSSPKAALVAYDAVQKCMSTTVDLYWNAYLERGGSYATAWSIGQIIEGTLAISRVPDSPSHTQITKQLAQELQGLSYYWDGSASTPGYDSYVRAPFGAGSSKFYDDNDWLGIALLQTYKYNHNTSLLNRAEQIFVLEQHGTVGTDKYPRPGGVFWTQTAGDFYRATVSTAGAVQLAAQLYLVTHQSMYLQFAVTEFNWVNANLLAPNGLYSDGVNANGSISTTKWSYNQGLMLGDSTLLYLATGDKSYLTQAQKIATTALAYYATPAHPLSAQPPMFNAIFFKNLILLASVTGSNSYKLVLQKYASFLWSQMSPTGLLHFKGTTSMLYQGAAVQVFSYLSLPPAEVNLS